jgi:hypothetical protein
LFYVAVDFLLVVGVVGGGVAVVVVFVRSAFITLSHVYYLSLSLSIQATTRTVWSSVTSRCRSA